jgi:hypothetical protein
MTKAQIKDIAKWQSAIRILANSKSAEVTSTTPDSVQFNMSPEEFTRFQNSLANPRILRENVIHLQQDRSAAASAALALPTLPSSKWLNNATRLIPSLLSESFIKWMHINPTKFTDDKSRHVLTYELEGSPGSLKTRIGGFENLQYAVSDPNKIVRILNKEQGKISDSDDDVVEPSDFAKQLININRISSTKAIVIFNYGFLAQYMQRFDKKVSTSPVLAYAPHSRNYSIDKKYFVEFNSKVFELGMALGVSERDPKLLDAVLFHPSEDQVYAAEYTFGIDISDSMTSVFSTYKEKLKDTITKLITVDQNNNLPWEVNFVPFGGRVLDTIEFSSEKGNSLEQIIKTIDDLEIFPGTDLYGALDTGYKRVQRPASKATNRVFVMVTDGVDTIRGDEEARKRYAEQLDKESADLLLRNPQTKVITFGYGEDYNREFFTKKAQDAGFTHVHMDNVEELAAVTTELGAIHARQFVTQFIANERTRYVQCAAGELVVASGLSENVRIRRGDVEYAPNRGIAELPVRGAQAESKDEKFPVSKASSSTSTSSGETKGETAPAKATIRYTSVARDEPKRESKYGEDSMAARIHAAVDRGHQAASGASSSTSSSSSYTEAVLKEYSGGSMPTSHAAAAVSSKEAAKKASQTK